MIVLKDCLCIVRPNPSDSGNLAGADIHLDGNRIVRVGKGLPVPEGARVIDASRHVVTPGFVNTHHHFYQTLTRNLPAVQNAKLFEWLVYLYEVWKGIDEEAVYWSSRLALAELVKTGCTCTTDHHYLYPQGFSQDLPGIQFQAAADIGMRFAPTRGSMSRSRKDGGLPRTRWSRTRTPSWPSARRRSGSTTIRRPIRCAGWPWPPAAPSRCRPSP